MTKNFNEADSFKKLSWEGIFKDYEPKLKRYLFYLLPYEDQEKWQDILQDIFLKLLEKSNKEDFFLNRISKESFNTNQYLYKIIKNYVVDYERKKRKNKEFPESLIQYKVENISEEKSHLKKFLENPEAYSIEEEILRKETYECIYYYINSLKLEYREMIYLHYFENLSLKEIAEQLDIEYGAVSMRLQRARFRLRKLILKSCCIIHQNQNIYLQCDLKKEENQ